MTKRFLGKLSPQQFLREYWQKKPLLIKHAFFPFNPFISPKELTRLAMEDDAHARIVIKKNRTWELLHGPFRPSAFSRLPKKNWSLLVQNVNQFLPAAEDFLNQFDFIPRARLDDLMVSFATVGGGVGPHFDSYDVFLVQAQGKRRWKLGPQPNPSFVSNIDLKILRNFHTRHEFIVEPGDLLYLPPGYGHHGIALDDCVTYSIGFRAPSQSEVATGFLNYLQDNLKLDGIYSDPKITFSRHPASISEAMVSWTLNTLNTLRWNKQDVARFLGLYLSEPKAHVYFTPPSKPMPYDAFYKHLQIDDLRLHGKSIMLLHSHTVFINAESLNITAANRAVFLELADRRTLKKKFKITSEVARILYDWYQNGYVVWANSHQ